MAATAGEVVIAEDSSRLFFQQLFSNLVKECDADAPAHQVSGWTDIPSAEEWASYVRSLLRDQDHCAGFLDSLHKSTNILEVGCGVLGFLQPLMALCPQLIPHGIDGSHEAIVVCQQKLPGYKDNFSFGFAPEALQQVPSQSHKIVVANSLFQYLSSLDQAQETILEMLRIAKPGGLVLLADLCDKAFEENTKKRLQELGWLNQGATPPSYLHFTPEWFDKPSFQKYTVAIHLARVQEINYTRRFERFNVYMYLKSNLIGSS